MVNKCPLVFSFFGMCFLSFALYAILGDKNIQEVFLAPFIHSVLFPRVFILADPPASPAKYRDQAVFGILAGANSSVIYVMDGGLTYLLIGLLAAGDLHMPPTNQGANDKKPLNGRLGRQLLDNGQK